MIPFLEKENSETMNQTVKGGAVVVKGSGGVGWTRPREVFTLYNACFFNASVLYKDHCYVYKWKRNKYLKKWVHL